MKSPSQFYEPNPVSVPVAAVAEAENILSGVNLYIL
jgi:hypothetical protein